MHPRENPLQPPRRAKPRLGCFAQAVLLLALLVVVLFGLPAVFTPWGFYLGGNFHIIPYWQGWGKLHAKTGDFALFVRIEPSRHGNSRYGTYVTGVAYLCTPRGETFRMHLGGTMPPHVGISTDGKPLRLRMFRYSTFSGDERPQLDLRGQWQNPNLVMNDGGSLTYGFNPDGSVYEGHDPNRPHGVDPLPVTLNQGSYSGFEAACSAGRR